MDLPNMIQAIARFLQRPLNKTQLDKVVYKSSFDYMRDHEYQFEMFSPNVFSVSKEEIRFMQSGALNRHEDTNNHERQRINAFCRQKLQDSSYPLSRFYPDVCQNDKPEQQRKLYR